MERIVVVYERVSTDRQDMSRQAVQRERATADHPEAELVVLQDDGVSAYKVPIFERPGGRELCDRIATGTVEAVYVDAQDRLSRGEDDEWVMFRALCDANDTWIVVDGQRITRDLGGKAISYLRALLARQESEEKAHRTRSGLREAARQGRYPVGAPPYGYRSVGTKRERRFLVEPGEAVVVRRIFDEYVAGVGVNRIAARLNEDGIRTRQGSLFSARSILAVLPNRTYLGEVCLKGETLATGAHEPIIDQEVFAQAERLRAAKKSRPNGGAGRPAKRHLLDGLLCCPNGHRMLARRRGNNEYYVCSRRHTYGDCDAPTASRRRVDETLLHHFLIRHFDEDEMRERLRTAADEKITEAQALAGQADREEQEAVAALRRIRRDYVAGKIDADDWHELRADLEEAQAASRAKAAQLRTRAREIKAEAVQVDVEAQLVARLGAVMHAVAGQADNPDAITELRAALTATFERIVYQPVWRDVPAGAPIVLGPAELAPVLRSDLLAKPDSDSCAKDRVRSGVISSALDWPSKRRITVNLAPAALRKEGSGFDLPISLAVLAATRQVPPERLAEHASVGELALDGRVRPVSGALAVAEGARRAGLSRVVCAAESAGEIALAGVEPVPVEHLGQVVAYFRGEIEAPGYEPVPAAALDPTAVPDLADVRGQERGRRALEIAAAGAHNLLLTGPPGTGKTMLGRRLPGILPPLVREEALEVTRIHSVCGLLAADRPLITVPPFRAPHHGASAPAIVGGGPSPRPGEVSLAHRGVLLLDELPEFPRSVLESLRQPLEDGVVSVARVGGHALFPARFVLVGTMNMCPCGARGDPALECGCSPKRLAAYREKLSRALLDRFDLAVAMPRPRAAELAAPPGEGSDSVRERVEGARARLRVSLPRRTEAASELLSNAVERLPLSGRGRVRVARVARTIAALAGAEEVEPAHVAEALSYRMPAS